MPGGLAFIPDGPTVLVPLFPSDIRGLYLSQMTDLHSGITPFELERGVKSILAAIHIAVREYNKYKSNAGDDLPQVVLSALDTLSALITFLDALNAPGPL